MSFTQSGRLKLPSKVVRTCPQPGRSTPLDEISAGGPAKRLRQPVSVLAGVWFLKSPARSLEHEHQSAPGTLSWPCLGLMQCLAMQRLTPCMEKNLDQSSSPCMAQAKQAGRC
jgi:hypothetical protein